MHSGDFGTKSHCRKAIVTNFPAGNPKMLCIFGGTDKSVPYNPIVIWRIDKLQLPPMERYRAWVMGVDHRTRWCEIVSGHWPPNSNLSSLLHCKKRKIVIG
jgi:hypothetical protein